MVPVPVADKLSRLIVHACMQTILGKDLDPATVAALKAWKDGDA